MFRYFCNFRNSKPVVKNCRQNPQATLMILPRIVKQTNLVYKHHDVCKIRHEVSILRAIGPHHTIVTLKAFHVSGVDIGTLITPLAYCDAFQLVEQYTISRDTGLVFIKFIISAVTFIHSMGFFHGRVKLENVLVYGNESFKLCDFQAADRKRSVTLTQQALLSPDVYYAPEAFTGGETDMFQQDVWATGMSIFCFWCRLRPPFFAANIEVDEVLTQSHNIIHGDSKVSCAARFFDNQRAYIIHSFCRFSEHEALMQSILVSKMLTSSTERCTFV